MRSGGSTSGGTCRQRGGMVDERCYRGPARQGKGAVEGPPSDPIRPADNHVRMVAQEIMVNKKLMWHIGHVMVERVPWPIRSLLGCSAPSSQRHL